MSDEAQQLWALLVGMGVGQMQACKTDAEVMRVAMRSIQAMHDAYATLSAMVEIGAVSGTAQPGETT